MDPNNNQSRLEPMSSVRMAYLVSQYPGISHTFILREVLRLRELGFEIEVASINAPDRPPERLTAAEQAEAARTYYVKRHGAAGALAAKWVDGLLVAPSDAEGLAAACPIPPVR